jgi:hypothetical protein
MLRRMKRLLACSLVVVAHAAVAAPPRGAAPQIFAPGVISSPALDGTPTFAPDGNTLLFTRSGANGAESVILISTRTHGGWSTPEIAPFSGQWYDSSPAFAPDGSYAVFQSSRPPAPLPPHHKPAPVPSHLWRVDRAGAGWSAAVPLADTVNISANVYRPSIAGDGTLYFISKAAPDQKFRMYRAKLAGKTYQAAEALSFSDGSTLDVDPEIARDQSFIVFASAGRAPYAKDTHEHLFIVFDRHGTWGPVTPLAYDGDDWPSITTDDDPRLGVDGRTLYFSSDRSPPVSYPLAQTKADLERMLLWDNGNTNVWSLSIAPWLAG